MSETDETTPPATVRVYKKQNDQQTSIFGEHVQRDEAGKEFFDVPAHLKPLVDQEINLTWPEGE